MSQEWWDLALDNNTLHSADQEASNSTDLLYP